MRCLTIRGEAQPATDNACHRPSRQMRAYTGCCLQRIVRPQKCDNHNKQRKPQRPPNGSCRTCPITRTGEAKTDALPKSFTTNRTTEIIASKETHVKSKRCGLTKKAEPPPTRDVNRDSGTDSANGGWLRRLVRPHGQSHKSISRCVSLTVNSPNHSSNPAQNSPTKKKVDEHYG